MSTEIFANPSTDPDILFSTGTVVDGAEVFAADLPDIGGGADTGWNLTQWNDPSDAILDPDEASVLASDADTLLGPALAAFHAGTASDGASLVVYGSATDATFALGSTGGSTQDTFLQTTGYASPDVTFDHSLVFTAQERVSAASATDGTAIAFNGFTVFFNEAGSAGYDSSLPSTELFLQIPLTDYRGEPAPYQTVTATDTYQQIYNLSSESVSATGGMASDASVDYLAFSADSGDLHTVTIDLNQALLRMVETMAAQVTATDPALASAYLDLARWSLGSYYGGVETSGGSGTTLTLDIADPQVAEDDAVSQSAATPLSTVQSIDSGLYADVETVDTVTTLSGTTNTITLSAGDGMAKTVTSNGADSVALDAGETVTLHALGTSLAVIGGGRDTVRIDGTAPLAVSGAFASLSIDDAATGSSIVASASAATLTLAGDDDQVAVTGSVSAILSGSDDDLAASAGSVVLDGDGNAIDLSGGGAQTVFLNGHDADVTESGTGQQVVVGTAAQSGTVTLVGGHGSQTLWTGGSDSVVTASADPTASLAVRVQAGGTANVQLGAETTLVDDEGGTATLQGSVSAAGVTLSDQSGAMTVWGGAETLVASLGGSGRLQIEAGSGSQTVFDGGGSLVVLGSHAVLGQQLVVGGADPAASATLFGGLTAQTIWTGQASDVIVSSVLPTDAAGTIQAMIQGGASAYWGGVESAVLDNLGGTLDAMLSGSGHVDILADLAASTRTVVTGFAGSGDSLTLTGVTDPASISVATGGGSTTLSWSGGAGTVTLSGLSHVTLVASPDGVSVGT